jgi:hypothetical protein
VFGLGGGQVCYNHDDRRQDPSSASTEDTMPAVHRRAPSRDAELGKRDDDFRPRTSPAKSGSMLSPWRWRKRRVVWIILGAILLYLFVHNIPTDLKPIDERLGQPLRPGHVVHGPQEVREPTGAPPRAVAERDEVQGDHYYNGPVKFYRLATTLRGVSRTGGARTSNRNILYAASSLKSIANLMPMACEMGKADRNFVHLAILGRDAIALEDILEINGVDKDACSVYFHDARADYGEFSSDMRAEVSVAGAMKHINDFIHPQAVIMDDSNIEDVFFIRAMRRKCKEFGRALIEIPEDKYEEFLWLTRLDSGSLANWFSPSIDILIHAPPESSGGLIRLLKSLERADYTGLRAPRLTIELPNDIEAFAKRYIEELLWPPDMKASPLRTNAVSLRHRIPTSRMNSEQASVRFVESFFPASTNDDHVLILSTQAEVHPLYLQYLYYHILEYRYSAFSVPEADDLLGLALDVPTSYVNGSEGFEPPTMHDLIDNGGEKYPNLDLNDKAPFIYQAPSSAASLIFGDKWTTFHNFLSRRLQMSDAGKAEKHTKQVSETEPAWMEYLLELVNARAWNMLHPATPFAAVHSELARIPEEYVRPSKDEKNEPEIQRALKDEPFLTAEEPPTVKHHPENEQPINFMPLHNSLPFNGDLPELPNLPHVYRNGKLFTPEGNLEFQETYQSWFREHIGGCDSDSAKKKRLVHWLSADDLFCVPAIPPDYFVEEEVESQSVAEAIIESTEPVKQAAKGEEKGSVKPEGSDNRDISGTGEVDDGGAASHDEQVGVQV